MTNFEPCGTVDIFKIRERKYIAAANTSNGRFERSKHGLQTDTRQAVENETGRDWQLS